MVHADLRDGRACRRLYRGRWRSDKDGREFGFAGIFREVEPPSRLVHTQIFDPGTVGDVHPENEAVVSVTFTEVAA